MKKFRYLTNCINAEGEDIQAMCDASTEITYRTFIKHVPIEEIKRLFPFYDWSGQGLHIKNDFMVSYYKSKYKGIPCYYLEHSRIEYIFV